MVMPENFQEKIMKKRNVVKSLLTLALFFCGQSVFAQIRNYVGIVRQQYFPEHVKYFESYRDELKEKGLSTYAGYIDSYLKGGFGSGFVYVAKDGTNYVITNRHVVSQAATVSVEFEDGESGEIKKYENLKVLLTDDDIDIAILGFDAGAKPFKQGLTFSSASVKDGQEVWSAGFPGLGSEPVWQLGKGSVTNAKARLKDLLDPSVSTIIQHSAQIDGGNSGGPLMIASSSATGYDVVGINTWKAYRRDSTNFAIPADVIVKMLDRVGKKSSDKTDLIKARTAKFAESLKDLSSDFTSIAKYISYERASVQGQDDFESVLHFAPSSVRSTVLDAFSYDPAEGLRYASAYQIWKKMSAKENDGKVFTVSAPAAKDKAMSVEFTAEDSTKFETEWIEEHGLWRLNAVSTDSKDSDSKKSDSKKKNDNSSSYFDSVKLDDFDHIHLCGGVDLSTKGYDKAIDLRASFLWNTLSGMEIDLQSFKHEDQSFFAFGPGYIIRVPLTFGQLALTPYAKAGVLMGVGDERVLIGWTLDAGLRILLNAQESFHFGIGAGYRIESLGQFMDTSTGFSERDSLPDYKNNSLAVYAIISF